MTPLKLLLIEDSETDERLICRSLSRGGFDVELVRVQTEEALLAALPEREWGIILADYMLTGFTFERVLEIVHASGLDIPVIALSGTVSEETILKLLRAGARDY